MATRPVYNNPTAVTRIKVNQNNFKKLLTTAEAVFFYMTANVAYFATPSPALSTLTASILALRTALAARNNKFNKGSSSNLITVKNAAVTLVENLIALQSYVANTVDYQGNLAQEINSNLALSGLALKNPKSIPTTFGAVQALHQVNSKKYPYTAGIMRWKKPIGQLQGRKPKAYLIKFVGTVTGSLTVTKTFVQVPGPGQWTVTVTPLGPLGPGTASTVSCFRSV